MENATLSPSLATAQSTTTSLHQGWIIENSLGKFLVQTPTGLILASKAFSCLVVPEIEDQVLLFTTEAETAVITSILDRPNNQSMYIGLEQDTKIENLHGSLKILAKKNLELSSPECTKLHTCSLEIRSQDCNLTSGNLDACADTVVVKASKAKLFLDQIETLAGRYSLHANNYYRWIKECEQLKVKNWITCVQKTLSFRSNQAVIQAKQDIKIDGERVHLG